MENASKALMIAGAVLITILVLGIAMYFFTQFREFPKEQEAAIEREQIAKFNQEYESYNKQKMYGVDVVTILNTIRTNSSAMYVERVPEATRNNLEAVGNAIMSYEVHTNEFLNALVNRIAFTIVSNRRYKNPLAVLKKAGKPFGTDIEEIYTNPVSAVSFNGSATDDMLKVTKPDVKTIFHRMNRQDKYPVSISTPQLQKAFTSFGKKSIFMQR